MSVEQITFEQCAELQAALAFSADVNGAMAPFKLVALNYLTQEGKQDEIEDAARVAAMAAEDCMLSRFRALAVCEEGASGDEVGDVLSREGQYGKAAGVKKEVFNTLKAQLS